MRNVLVLLLFVASAAWGQTVTKVKTDQLPAALDSGSLKVKQQGTVTVSGSVTATTGGLTDAELRATPVPVSGPLTDAQLRAAVVPVSIPGTITANSEWGVADRDPFGEVRFAAPIVSVVEASFEYGVSSQHVSTLLSSGGAVVASGASGNGSDLVVSIDNAANAFALARSARSVNYRPGIGQEVRITAAFPSGAANMLQYAGMFSPVAGWMFCKSGTTWGVCAKTAGAQSVYRLRFTSGATVAGNITLTLDGVAVTIALTNSPGSTTAAAWETAKASFAATVTGGAWGWDAQAVGADVFLVAKRARATAGAFSFAAGATGSAATLTQIRAGVAETVEFGSPATPGNFVFEDAIDGSGPSGVTYDKTKSLIYIIRAGHLGFRGADYYVMNPATGKPIRVARYNRYNTGTASFQQNPDMYVGAGIEANGSTTAATLYVGSWFGGISKAPNQDIAEDSRWNATAAKTPSSATPTHFLTIGNQIALGFGGQTQRAGRADVHMHACHIATTGGASNSYGDVAFVRGGTLPNTANFAQINSSTLSALAWQDNTTTADWGGGSSGTTERTIRVLNGTAIEFEDNWVIGPNEIMSAIITPSAGSMTWRISCNGHEVH